MSAISTITTIATTDAPQTVSQPAPTKRTRQPKIDPVTGQPIVPKRRRRYDPLTKKPFKSCTRRLEREFRNKQIEEHKISGPRTAFNFYTSEVSGPQWNAMTLEQKQPYLEKERKSREMHKNLIANLPKPDLGPKRPITSFLQFSIDFRPQIQRQHPEKSSTEVSTVLKHMWAADPSLRERYKQQYEQRKAKYEQEVDEYLAAREIIAQQQQTQPQVVAASA